MDSHHNVDAKTATKVRFMEPGVQQANGAIDETQDKFATDDAASEKASETCDDSEKMEDCKQLPDEETQLINGSSPKPEKRENSEKDSKENDQKSNEQTTEIPAEEKPPITP